MGVTVEILKEGTSSRKPQAKEVVHCHYVGTLLDGTVFDSSVSRAKPLTFMIGIGSVIKCWDEGIRQLTLGSKAKLTCTPDYGYGVDGFPPSIPPNSDLVFEVELLQIADEKASSGPGCSIQ